VGDGAGVIATARAGQRSADATTAGTLRIVEGHTGRIATGTSVPVTTVTPRRVETTYVSADSGVEVRPRILGDGRVQLDLAPFGASLQPGGAIATFRAATTATVAPGESVVIGGIDRSREEVAREILTGAASGRRAGQRVLIIRVEVESLAPPHTR
jgi:type II secretory pathway component HofQ